MAAAAPRGAGAEPRGKQAPAARLSRRRRANSPKCWPPPSRDDIAGSGWQVGSVFGTEAALLERYRVSRAVLREAVRLLEYHAVAPHAPRARRRAGGRPNPQAQASIDTIALYLQYRKPSREDLRCVRDAIEIDNVAKVVKRRDEPEVRAFSTPIGPGRWQAAADADVRQGRRRGVPVPCRPGEARRQRACWICSCGSSSNCSAGTGPAPGRPLPTWSDVVAVAPRSPADYRGDRGRRRQPGPLPHPPPPGRRRVVVAVTARWRARYMARQCGEPECDLLRGIANARLGY